jgi:tRNA threonylcarbamoyladenosine biosynthesis protein TsaB
MAELFLALDGALGPFSVALVERGPGGLERSAAGAQNAALEHGLELVEEVLAGTPPAALAAIAVSTGPGSYTGMRIALSYAKALALARRLPLVPVNSYDVLDWPQGSGPAAAFVAGRPGRVCARLRLGSARQVFCGSDDEVADALAGALEPGTALACSGAWQGAAPRLGERGIIVQASPPFESPPALAVARRALRGEPAASPHAVSADYGEHAGAVT